MIRLIIIGAVAFVLGLGGTTGVLVVTSPALPPGADSLAAAHAAAARQAHATADDAHGASTNAEKPAGAGHEATAEAHPAPDAAPAPVTPPDASIAAQPQRETVVPPAPATGVHEGRSAAAPDAESYKQVGNILMNMKPVEAAKILAYLSDAQVEGLLRSMSPRNAASVLSQLPSERAATLSKRLLVPAPREEHR